MGSLLRRTPCLTRSFSTTPTLSAISPYSPNYIEIPKPAKTLPTFAPRPKGFLPAPRKIFRKTGEDKSSWHYIARATPPSTTASKRGPRISQTAAPTEATLSKLQVAQRLQWERQMAESRRKNLREGLLELHSRHTRRLERHHAQSQQRREEREALLMAKEKDDVRLTLPTLLTTSSLVNQDVYKQRQLEMLEDKKKIYEAKQAKKSRHRQKMIHELYVNARDFIITEAQLDAAIDKEFTANTASGQMGVQSDPRDMLLRTADSTLGYTEAGKSASAEVGEAIMGGSIPAEQKTDITDIGSTYEQPTRYGGNRNRSWSNRTF